GPTPLVPPECPRGLQLCRRCSSAFVLLLLLPGLQVRRWNCTMPRVLHAPKKLCDLGFELRDALNDCGKRGHTISSLLGPYSLSISFNCSIGTGGFKPCWPPLR